MNNTDTLSLLQCLLIASWYLGFLAADVAPAAGQGSGNISSGALGFFPLKLRGKWSRNGLPSPLLQNILCRFSANRLFVPLQSMRQSTSRLLVLTLVRSSWR